MIEYYENKFLRDLPNFNFIKYFKQIAIITDNNIYNLFVINDLMLKGYIIAYILDIFFGFSLRTGLVGGACQASRKWQTPHAVRVSTLEAS